MRIPSDEIPQADLITDVVRTVICISQGGQSFQDIATAINKVERQGRYYRKAAEIIGLIATPTTNHSILTDLGREFIRTGSTLTNPIFIQAVLSARIFQRLIPFLELNSANGVTRDQIIAFVASVADLEGGSMAGRRFSSLVAWLEELNIISRQNDRFYLSAPVVNNAVQILNFTNADEPILPRATSLQEYEEVRLRTSRAGETIVTYRDLAATERADNAHRTLVNLVASRIRNSGSIPRYNQLIDLATRHNDNDYIFEMKSITPSNSKTQVRNGLSQLYEYKYLQNLPDSRLILVVETPLPADTRWMTEYLESDRNINVVWDGNDQLYGTERTRNDLPFLGILPPT